MSLEDLIAAERARPAEPTSAEAKSIWKRLRTGGGAVVPPAFDVSPASTVVTLKVKIGAALSSAIGKVVVGTAVVGTVAGGTAAVVSTSAPTEATAEREVAKAEGGAKAKRAAEVKAVAAPEVVAVPTEVPEVPVPAEVPEVPAIAEAQVPAPAIVPAANEVDAPAPAKRRAKESSTFGEEMALIRKAQRALAGGRADAALATLAEHERKFPRGSMNEDRLALRALALCSAGRHDEGRRAAKLLEQRFPRSLYAERVDERCK